ncbi:MAG: hypothetical protein ACHP7D_06790 [Lysobacterales bacterium]
MSKLTVSLVIGGLAIVSIAANGAASGGPVASARSTAIQQARNELRQMNNSVSDDEVGDSDSFGRGVNYIGLDQTGIVTFAADCTPPPGEPPPGPDDRCVTLAPPPAVTNYDIADIARVNLPARATHSLVCFGVTPYAFWDYFNPTAAPQTAQFSYAAYFTIENEVLDDPSLINPQTGLPFGGRIDDLGIGTQFRESRALSAGAGEFHQQTLSRQCIDGLVSRRALHATYGLPDHVIDQFYKKPMTIRSNLHGVAQSVDQAQVFYGTRFYGD